MLLIKWFHSYCHGPVVDHVGEEPILSSRETNHPCGKLFITVFSMTGMWSECTTECRLADKCFLKMWIFSYVTYYNNTGPGKYVLFLLQQGITKFFGIVAFLSYSVLSFCSFFILSRDKTSFSLWTKTLEA